MHTKRPIPLAGHDPARPGLDGRLCFYFSLKYVHCSHSCFFRTSPHTLFVFFEFLVSFQTGVLAHARHTHWVIANRAMFRVLHIVRICHTAETLVSAN